LRPVSGLTLGMLHSSVCPKTSFLRAHRLFHTYLRYHDPEHIEFELDHALFRFLKLPGMPIWSRFRTFSPLFMVLNRRLSGYTSFPSTRSTPSQDHDPLMVSQQRRGFIIRTHNPICAAVERLLTTFFRSRLWLYSICLAVA
jgi:hypothetical protein